MKLSKKKKKKQFLTFVVAGFLKICLHYTKTGFRWYAFLIHFDGLFIQFDGFPVPFDGFFVLFVGFSVQFDGFSVQLEVCFICIWRIFPSIWRFFAIWPLTNFKGLFDGFYLLNCPSMQMKHLLRMHLKYKNYNGNLYKKFWVKLEFDGIRFWRAFFDEKCFLSNIDFDDIRFWRAFFDGHFLTGNVFYRTYF